MTSNTRKRKEIHIQAREMIAKVYHFLREEYDFMKQNNFDKCDLTPLANVRKRTAEATGVSERTVTQVLKEERESTMLDGTARKRIKKDKKQSAKKKLRNNDDGNVDKKYEETTIDFWPIQNLGRLKPETCFLNSIPEPRWMTCLNPESTASKYLATFNLTMNFMKFQLKLKTFCDLVLYCVEKLLV